MIFILLFAAMSCKNTNKLTDPDNIDEPINNNYIYKIAFVSDREVEGQYQVYTMDSNGSNLVKLTHDSFIYLHPRFSPDGTKIVFYSNSYEGDNIFIMDSDGSNPTNLTQTTANDNYPQFSPDGSKIVFTSDRDGNREVYIMNVDGSNQLRLTDNSLLDHAPLFSPDGSKILFYSVDDQWNYYIFTMDCEGNNLTLLICEEEYAHMPYVIGSNHWSVYFYGPQYSPDGSKIVFVSYSFEEYNWDIYIMNSDGSRQTRLTDTPGFNFNPRFFPDGTKIAFMTHREGNFDIYSMDLEGKNQIPIYDSATGHALFSQFSPDGLKILLSDNNVRADNYDIFIINTDGSNLTQLTNGSNNDIFPQFQPQH